ncbi:DUF6090 family protein [Algoriphagus namhaensis]|uniref:DUF6090 family protein n=1 Tax=Algoriphagus namhaensis TaxID=915353 RepID=A0ABV8AP14_9BACT
MVSIFRKIRRALLEQNKVTRYLAYAVGEIALVMIGILLALQVNNWNENRKDRIKEQKVLLELKTLFEENIAQLEDKILIRKNIIQKAGEVISYIDNNEEVQLDTLTQKLSAIILAPTYDPIDNGLMDSENLQLLSNDSLRRMLSKFPSGIADLKQQEDEFVKLYFNSITPFLIQNGLARDVHQSFYGDAANLTYMLDNSVVNQINLGKSKKKTNVMGILNDVEFESILATTLSVNVGVNWESESYRKQMLEILNFITSEIDPD